MSLQTKIRTLIKSHKSSIPKLAAAIGVPEQTLMYSLRAGGKIPFETVVKIAREYRVPLETFAEEGPEKEATVEYETLQYASEILDLALRKANKQLFVRQSEEVPLNLESFLWWWESNSGRLENFDSVKPYVDFFEPPSNDSNIIQPVEVGRRSLAAVYFKLQSAEELSHTLDGFSAPLNRDLVSAHLTALDRNEPVITYPTLDESLPDGTRVSGKYRRVLAPLTHDGRTIIVNFSQQIPDHPLPLSASG
ncbi:helix-turn-helix domain-containing protein [Shimia ponticola]|uniref:helix-turn-helix domain-containing protein n=1 Tax=Shimia ponticola TaxID=2582893 RepID=UPI0011BE2A23|nr:helix-turn-helix transcriptional regulator [Shimia ponticola]